jgi:autotransporter-associated beta strand protein
MQKIALILLPAIALCSFTTAHAQTTSTSTNTIQGGGTISAGNTAVITDPVTSVTGAITDNGLLLFTQSGSLSNAFAISGTGSVTMAGTGTTTFTGINTYTGITTVDAGTLILKAGAPGVGIIPGNAVVNNGGTLQIYAKAQSGIVPTYNTTIVTVNGGGTLAFTGAGANQDDMAYLGTVTLSNTGGSAAVANSPDGSGIRFGNSGLNGTVNSYGTTTNTFGANIVLVKNGGGTTMTFNTGTSSALVVSGGIADYTGLTGTPVVVSGSGTTTLSGTSTYAGTTTITNSTLVVSGLLGGGSYGAGITNNGSLVFSNSANQTLSGVVSGSGTLTKAGPGTVTLSQANAFTGGTLVGKGTLVGNASASYGSGAIVLGDGNTGTSSIVLMADTTASTTIANAITVANLGTGLVSIGGTNTGASNANAWTGTLTLNRNVQVFNDTPHAGGRTSFLGQITGSGGITVTQGRGRVTLQNGTNNFTGPVVVDSGATLQLDVATGLNEVIPNSAAVTVNGSLNLASGGGTETIGSLAGSGTVSSVVSGNYSVVVGGSTNTTFSGVINNGTGVIGLTKSGAGTLTLSGPNSYTGGTIVSAGQLVGTTASLQGAITNNASVTFDQATTGNYGSTMSGSGSLTKLGVGTVRITGSNGYSGGTTVSSGTVEVSAGGSGGGSAAGLGTGTVAVASGAQVTYWLSNTGSHTISNAFSLSGGTLYTEDGANTFSGQVMLASGTSTISSRYEDTITLSGGLTGSGNVLFTQAGGLGDGPTYVLSGTGSNTGTVRVSGSSNGRVTKLQVANINALQSATLDMAAGDVGSVEFTVAGINTYSLGGLQGTRNLAVGGNSVSVGGNNQSTTYSGNLSASGLFTKVGGGTLTLSGSNSASGGVAVNAGTLALGSANAIGSTGTISFGGGALQFTASNTTDYSARFSNAASQQYRIDTNGQNVTLASALTSSGGSLTKNGPGNLILTATSAFTGPTTVSAGRLSVNGALGNTAVTVAGGAELGGSGSIVGGLAVLSGGTLSPGNSIASLAGGATSFAAGSTFGYEVDSSLVGSLGTAADLLVVSGNLDIALGALLSLSDITSGTVQPFVKDSTVFAMINYSGSWNGGLFSYNGTPLADGGTFTVGSQQWQIDYNYVYNTASPTTIRPLNFQGDYLPSTGTQTFVAITAVPEPATIAMALAGLACGGYSVVRRRKRA